MIRIASTLGIFTLAAFLGCGGNNTGSAQEKLAIGSACVQDSDCGAMPFYCMTDHPGGYCMKDCNIANGDADCPAEAVCQFDGMKGECHKKCDTNNDCRTMYTCSPAAQAADNKVSHAFCDMIDTTTGDGGA